MIIFVDPGASGGIGRMIQGRQVTVYPMPDTDTDTKDIIVGMLIDAKTYEGEGFEKRAVIEKVGGFVGGVGQPGSLMFGFGDGYGFIRGLLMAYGFRIERPTPQAWQKVLGLGTKEKVDKPFSPTPEAIKAYKVKLAKANQDWKNKLKAKAQELHPNIKVTLKTSDALLILEAAKRTSF